MRRCGKMDERPPASRPWQGGRDDRIVGGIEVRVLFIGAHVGKGGGLALQTFQLFELLRSRIDVQLLCLDAPGLHRALADRPGVMVAGPLSFPGGIGLLRRALRSLHNDFDVFQTLDPYFSISASYLAHVSPRIIHLGTDPRAEIGWRYGFPAGLAARAIYPALLSGAVLVANSHALADRFPHRTPHVIPNGIDLRKFERLPNQADAARSPGISPPQTCSSSLRSSRDSRTPSWKRWRPVSRSWRPTSRRTASSSIPARPASSRKIRLRWRRRSRSSSGTTGCVARSGPPAGRTSGSGSRPMRAPRPIWPSMSRSSETARIVRAPPGDESSRGPIREIGPELDVLSERAVHREPLGDDLPRPLPKPPMQLGVRLQAAQSVDRLLRRAEFDAAPAVQHDLVAARHVRSDNRDPHRHRLEPDERRCRGGRRIVDRRQEVIGGDLRRTEAVGVMEHPEARALELAVPVLEVLRFEAEDELEPGGRAPQGQVRDAHGGLQVHLVRLLDEAGPKHDKAVVGDAQRPSRGFPLRLRGGRERAHVHAPTNPPNPS